MPLVARLGTDASLIAGVIETMSEAISDQYVRDVRAFDDAEGDNAWTFAQDLHAHSWARMVERVVEGSVVRLQEEGLAHAVLAGPLTVRPYKLGSDAPDDIRLVRLEANSDTKFRIAKSNDDVVRGQMSLDLSIGLPTPTEDEKNAAFAADQLVLGHFGNFLQGRRAIYLGAPRPTLKDGSYWEWVIKIASEGPDLGTQLVAPHGPPSPTKPFSEREEPEVPLAAREDERRRGTS